LPIPAAPTTVTIAGRRVAITSTNASLSAERSRPRPTSGLRGDGVRAGSIDNRRQAATGSVLPLSRSGATGSRRARSRRRRSVIGPMRISRGPAAPCRRSATLTGSPSVSASPPADAVKAISPVLIPVWVTSWTFHASPKSRLRVSSVARISSAARAARTTSSSCRRGTPNSAMTASPMNFSTTPPWRSTIRRISPR
jgi:hypothetical protein